MLSLADSYRGRHMQSGTSEGLIHVFQNYGEASSGRLKLGFLPVDNSTLVLNSILHSVCQGSLHPLYIHVEIRSTLVNSCFYTESLHIFSTLVYDIYLHQCSRATAEHRCKVKIKISTLFFSVYASQRIFRYLVTS
jgi:hypothetical protein